tara:strand:+ start:885 stop:1061 length:177 start_codon:yes stop_codon:yes gene_type:complete
MIYLKLVIYTLAIIVGVYQLITNKPIEEKKKKEILNKFLLAFFILFLTFQLIDIVRTF